MDETRLLKTKEAVKVLGIGERLLWSLTNEGEIPHIRIRGAVRYHPGDLDAYIDANRKGGTRTRKPA